MKPSRRTGRPIRGQHALAPKIEGGRYQGGRNAAQHTSEEVGRRSGQAPDGDIGPRRRVARSRPPAGSRSSQHASVIAARADGRPQPCGTEPHQCEESRLESSLAHTDEGEGRACGISGATAKYSQTGGEVGVRSRLWIHFSEACGSRRRRSSRMAGSRKWHRVQARNCGIAERDLGSPASRPPKGTRSSQILVARH